MYIRLLVSAVAWHHHQAVAAAFDCFGHEEVFAVQDGQPWLGWPNWRLGWHSPVMPGCAHCVSRITRTSGMPCLSIGLCSTCEMSLIA